MLSYLGNIQEHICWIHAVHGSGAASLPSGQKVRVCSGIAMMASRSVFPIGANLSRTPPKGGGKPHSRFDQLSQLGQ